MMELSDVKPALLRVGRCWMKNAKLKAEEWVVMSEAKAE
jgi:hypothetical protein